MNDAVLPGPPLNRVTIVVPVYGDWPSLRDCVTALIEHADARAYDVLLVNDCGPEADEIEAGLRGMIFGLPNFRYERNPANLGFVRTCNRAALELDNSANDILLLNSDTRVTAEALDELRAVLSLSERHAVVCPRSNDATIATIPFYQRDRFAERDGARAKSVFDLIADELPRYYIAPVAIGFCFLIRRTVIENHGLFDEIYGRGYNEENDFCLRLNSLGYSSLIANHAFVYHMGSTSFGAGQRAALEEANSKVLRARYPFYPDAVTHFIRNDYSAADRFADLLANPPVDFTVDPAGDQAGDRAVDPAVDPEVARAGARPKVLIDLHHLSLAHDGSTKNALSFLRYVASQPHPLPLDITVAAPEDVIEFFDLPAYGLRVIPYSEIGEVFDVGVAIAPVTALGQIATLNRFCLKWVVSYLDIIALRAWQLRLQVPYKTEIMRAALAHADRVIAISSATLDDALLFFPELSSLPGRAPLRERTRVIHQGSGTIHSEAGPADLSPAVDAETAAIIAAGGYHLVVGNAFPHKQLEQALLALETSAVPIVVLGNLAAAASFPRAHFLPGGSLTDEDVAITYSQAGIVIFPSAYEGFGLPVPEAVHHGKRIVVFDTAVAREITTALGLDDSVSFFSRFSELQDVVAQALDAPAGSSVDPQVDDVRSLADYNHDLWREIVAVAGAPADVHALDDRDADIRKISLVSENLLAQTAALTHELSEIKLSQKYRLAQQLGRVGAPLNRLLGRRVAPVQRIEMRDIDRS